MRSATIARAAVWVVLSAALWGCSETGALEVGPSSDASRGGVHDGGSAHDPGALRDAAGDPLTADAGRGGDASSRGAVLDDADVTAVIAAIDAAEIALASYVVDRAGSEAVYAYALEALDAHRTSLRELAELTARAGLAYSQHPLAAELRTTARVLMIYFDMLEGPDLDAAYLGAEVASHRDALALLDAEILPVVVDPSLRSFLVARRAGVAEHLARAEDMLASLRTR